MRLSKGRRRRSVLSSRRKRVNFVPILVLLFLFFLFFWTSKMLFGVLFGGDRDEIASVRLQILNGRAEFSLSENLETWTPAYSDQTFLAGDTIRTIGNSRVSLEFLGGNVVFLGPETEFKIIELEQKSSGKKIFLANLVKGKIWARVSDDDFGGEQKSEFTIVTDRLKLYVRGTIFALSSIDVQDVVRLIKGNVDVDIIDGEEDPQNVKVGVGQKLVVNSDSLQKIKNNEDVLEIIDNEFIESEWHLQNLDRFLPQEAAQIRRRIEISAVKAPVNEVVANSNGEEMPPPVILSPKNGDRILASLESLKIEGTAPENTVQIVVNDYTLTKFLPGDRKWSYFASNKFGTLVAGENTFTVVAISRDGRKSKPESISVFYEGGVSVETKINLNDVIESSINDFSAPVIIKPTVFSHDEPYQTSAPVVTISGLVDPKTNAVEINGFKLKKFTPGQTDFQYIANANYGNLKIGENIFKIVAFGPDGKTSETEIKIHYSPISLKE
jgi:hypothetical protein